MNILDMSAGNRAVWMNKKHPLATYLDIRPEVNPDMVCDTRTMSKVIKKKFDLFVFDPPHINVGKTSNMAKCYGHHTTAQIREVVFRSAREAHRMAKKNALMAFKWNDHDIKLKEILDSMQVYWEPLFGHHTRNGPSAKSQTYWVMLRRK